MWKIVALIACLALAYAESTTPLTEKTVKTIFTIICSNNAKLPEMDKMIEGYNTVERCEKEDNFKNITKGIYFAKTKDQWDPLYTELCNNLGGRKVCSDEAHQLIAECTTPEDYIRYAANFFGVINFWEHICTKAKSDVLEFLADNGVPCYLESVNKIVDCIKAERFKVSNILTDEQAAEIAEKCFVLEPCDAKKIEELQKKYDYLS